MNSADTLLKAQGLCKAYNERKVVDNVCLEVGAGEIVGLLGPNGAGKTTSFYMVAGLVRPDVGSVMFAGKDVSGLPMHLRARLGMGYLPQEESIFRKLSVEDNLMAILETRSDLSRKEKKDKMMELLERFQSQGDADTANKVGCTGVCAVLFLVGLGSFLSARKGMNALNEEEDEQENAENETEEQ